MNLFNVSCQLSVVSCQLLVVSCQLSVVSCPLSGVQKKERKLPNHQLPITNYFLLSCNLR
ncbi:hypothetical protein FJR38_15070 [Anabaena sp. UHCC 0253]|nr:hypothetical protein [Anabaena sp. UHCC 0253]